MPAVWLLCLLALPFVGASALLALPNTQRRSAAWLAGFVTLGAAALLIAVASPVWDGQLVRVRWEWLPSLNVGFGLRLDGLAMLFATLILGIGALVVLYGAYYLSNDDPPARFFAFLLFFMGAMLGVVLADNLILLVVFWELTSLSSFLLIGFWRYRDDARQGARMALAVTGAGGLALLAGVLLIGKVVGSYDLDIVLASKSVLQKSPLFTTILVLVLLGAFTKSAQFPFHFWLPRAMAAPTPVSAYLHSATMVKAGVFLLARLYPALGGNDVWFTIVTTAGVITLLMGAIVAIFQHDLKGLLAYSTISHLGLITLLFGLDTPLAVVAGVFHIINHAVFKASLFMAAGIIDHETGTRDMRKLNGLWKAMPITATLAMVASAAMAGVPLANGFLSKEMFFSEAVAATSGVSSYIIPVAATVAGIAGVAYSLRFIHDVFFNGSPVGLVKTPHEPPRFMRVPVEVLVVLCLVIGIFPSVTVGPLLAVAAAATLNAPLPVYTLSIWHGFNTAVVMSIAAMVGGAVLYAMLQKNRNLHAIAKLPGDAKVLFDVAIENLTAICGWLVRVVQNGSLSRYLMLTIATVVVAAIAGVALYPSVSPPTNATLGGELANPVVMAAAIAGMVAAVASVVSYRERLVAVLLLGFVGLTVSLAFVYFSAPDLALTQLLVEVATVVAMLLSLKYLPPTSRDAVAGRPRWRQWRDIALAALAGLGVTWLVYQVLQRPFNSISSYYLQTTVPQGGGANAVNVIIVDFRGMDTLGEIAVLVMAGLIVALLLRNIGMPKSSPKSNAGGQFEAKMPENARPSLMLNVATSLMMPFAMMVVVYFYLRGHNQPGGGFIAGLVFSMSIVLHWIAQGQRQSENQVVIRYAPLAGWGLLCAGITGVVAAFVGFPFLTSAYQYIPVPLLGPIPLASAMAFDLGVFLAVIGGTMLALSSMGAASDKHQTEAV